MKDIPTCLIDVNPSRAGTELSVNIMVVDADISNHDTDYVK